MAESTLIDDRCTETAGVEGIFAEVLADVLHVDRVSVDSHFFEDLGADSLVMAHFCARVRKRADLPPVSMKDIYRHSTIRGLATALVEPEPAPAEPSRVAISAAAVEETTKPASSRQYFLCGALQL